MHTLHFPSNFNANTDVCRKVKILGAKHHADYAGDKVKKSETREQRNGEQNRGNTKER